jgi:hypothetical protein
MTLNDALTTLSHWSIIKAKNLIGVSLKQKNLGKPLLNNKKSLGLQTLAIPGNPKGGRYHCTVDLLFDLFGLVCFANKNKYCQFSYS